MASNEPEFSLSGDEEVPESEVSTLELFFDLVFVYGFIQVGQFLLANPTWIGMVRGVALLAALWWAWVTYSWLTDAVPAHNIFSGQLVILSAMAAMFVVALAVPDAFGSAGLVFGIAYFVVRALHVGLYAVATDPETQQGIRRLAPGFLGGPAIIVAAGFFDGTVEGVLWAVALVIDYSVPYVRGNEEFQIRAEHFVERYRLIIIIALGEILIEMGFGVAELSLGIRVIVGAVFGMVIVIAFWLLYFDYVAPAAECRLVEIDGPERSRRALISYSYLHFLLVAGIIFSAFGIGEALAHIGTSLGLIFAVALYGGGALYLLGHTLFEQRDISRFSIAELAVAIVAVVLIPIAARLPALVALVGLALLFAGLAVYELRALEHDLGSRAET
jgi:low temperature requirement protein LtrA